MNEKISIIIPLFNSDRTIKRALDSVYAQSYKNIEIITVDDGSTDDTAAIVKNYPAEIRYCFQENAGPASARNRGLEMATGSWIAFLDADDVWMTDKLEKQIELLNRNPNLKWCCCNRWQSDGKRKAVFGNIKKITTAINGKDCFQNYFTAAAKGLCPIITTALIIHKSVFDELGMFDCQFLRGQDLDMWWRIANKYPQIGYIPEPLALRYLDDENPVTRKRRLQAMNGKVVLKLMEKHSKAIEENQDFKNFAANHLKLCLAVMTYCGYGKEVTDALNKFGKMLPVQWRLIYRACAVMPKTVSAISKIAYRTASILRLKNISRSDK